jgi:hypothetical protein
MKRRTRLFFSLLALLIVCILIGLFRPRERLLLRRAVRVTDTHGWEVDRGPDSCITYGWLSNQDVFFCQGGFLSETPLCRRNIHTGEQTSLKTLSRLFYLTGGDPDGVEVSPDGRWILWNSLQDATVCAAVDGSTFHLYPWPVKGYCGFHWSGGSVAQWIEFTAKRVDPPEQWSKVMLHQADSPTLSPPVARPIPFSSVPLALPTPFSDPLRNGVVVRTTEGLSLLTPTWSTRHGKQATDRVEITQTSLGVPVRPQRRYSLLVPPHHDVDKIVLSPDGKQAAWLMQTEAVHPILAWAHRLVPAIAAPSQHRIELWVSRVDGSEMHEIGHLSGPKDGANADIWLNDYTLNWLPDSRQLSFIYKEALYIVPAE